MSEYPKHVLRPVRTTREPGGIDADGPWYHSHVEYEARCHECGTWTEDYGNGDITLPDGTVLPVCNPCVAAWPAF